MNSGAIDYPAAAHTSAGFLVSRPSVGAIPRIRSRSGRSAMDSLTHAASNHLTLWRREVDNTLRTLRFGWVAVSTRLSTTDP